MSITLGNYSFDGPFDNAGSLDRRSGVYAILAKKSQLGTDFSVVDIGESADVRGRVENHDRTACWRRQEHASLSVAAHYCNDSSRVKIVSELRARYNPPCSPLA